jgi:hypothetical protein
MVFMCYCKLQHVETGNADSVVSKDTVAGLMFMDTFFEIMTIRRGRIE